ncbi:hypothetical protein ACUNV4_04810 [Granulosicoccus sp. 3-233]|uniref:hypothetical protein n=1 Tax=Granulosicoccus sp. 3-233 TaxID=3417969 RepID=UPI003D334DFA
MSHSKRIWLSGLICAVLLSACSDDDEADNPPAAGDEYQIWASDQSNSVADADGPGTKGSYLWIWNSEDMETQIAGGDDAIPVGCLPADDESVAVPAGPCDLLDVFPQELVEIDANGNPTGQTLADLNGFGRLHGMLADPQDRYVTASIFAPGGGFVGVIDTRTREAISLFRVTGTNVGDGTDVRSVHMSDWTTDGNAILVANLNGKVLERIDATRDAEGKITDIVFNRSASLGVGKGQVVTTSATTFSGNNAFGNPLLGSVGGDYANADFADLTPGGVCKENGCDGTDGALGGRPNNVIICPISSTGGNSYVTLGGGGLIIANTQSTPMSIVGEYGNQSVNGAGCGGIQTGDTVWINAGVSASAAGATQSVFTMYTFNDSDFQDVSNPQNTPAPMLLYKDEGNTATGGNETGVESNDSGQLPDATTRRDSHGMAPTVDGRYVHTVDRIRNVVEVFDSTEFNRTTYDLTSEDGRGNGEGPCLARSITDDAGLPQNDPAPDLVENTPDGKYLLIAFRGPSPVSVNHSAQGSCPGAGVVELTDDGAYGRLVTVLNTRNSVDTSAVSAPGGHAYSGTERSDVHGVISVRMP